jgi:hypothetical protein
MNEPTADQLKDFRAECLAGHNFPLARLCTDAIVGVERAKVRVAAIMAGQPDPGPERS